MAEPVIFENRQGVAYLTLNRPETGNAIDVPLAASLHRAVRRAEADPAVRCLVLRGEGRMFCVGGDVTVLSAAGEALPELLREILDHLHPAVERLALMDKPVVTAINGPAAGAGVGLAAVGDIAIAEPHAHFTLAYSRIGLSPDAGATWLLPRLIGLRRSQELALTNRRVLAPEAAEMGLITRVAQEQGLQDVVQSTAAALASSASRALGRTKRLLLNAGHTDLGEHLLRECEAIVSQGGSEESREGIRAFAARRRPDFSGLMAGSSC